MNRAVRRRPLSKTELLPLPTDKVRALSLEHHLALSVMRTGKGDAYQIIGLARVVYLAFFMRDITPDGADLAPLRQAEAALARCLDDVERGEPCALRDDESKSIEAIMALHDAQLAAAPLHRYRNAWERVQRYLVVGDVSSPIPPSI